MPIFSKKLKTYTEDSPHSWQNLIKAVTTNSGYEYYESYKSYSSEELSNLGATILTFILPGCEDWQIRECFLPTIKDDFLPVHRKADW